MPSISAIVRSTFLLCLGVLIGCGKSEPVRVYTISKEKRPVRRAMPNDAVHNPQAASAKGAPAKMVDGRMLAGLVRVGNSAWSFKLLGKADAVNQQKETFDKFVRSVRFGDDGKPTWTLPTGWTEAPGNQFSFASLMIDSSGTPLKVSISPTTFKDRTVEEDALLNINRWRSQLRLPPVSSLEDKDSGVESIDLDGKTMYLVDLAGKMNAGSRRGPMFGGPMSARPRVGGPQPAETRPTGSKANEVNRAKTQSTAPKE